jgi:hypothetical protein
MRNLKKRTIDFLIRIFIRKEELCGTYCTRKVSGEIIPWS